MARQIARSVDGAGRERFRYVDKGIMATIGRSRAVARIGRVRLPGFVAWVAWLLLHIVYLIDFRNRIAVLIDWAWSYVTYRRGSRLITGHRTEAGANERTGGRSWERTVESMGAQRPSHWATGSHGTGSPH